MGRLHPDETAADEALARRLVDGAFPAWRRLPLRPLPGAGTQNAILRLGDDLALRLPLTPGAAAAIRAEAAWLPRLGPLPCLHPPVALGEPALGFPFPFAVVPWVEGQDAWAAPPEDEAAFARDLGRLVAALRALDLPGPGLAHTNRGGPLAEGDAALRAALALAPEIDGARCLRAWDAALAAPAHDGPPRWFHGDLQPFNLIVRGGRLAAAIDWGAMGTGDPACDLMPAWQVFSTPAARAPFREATGAGEAEWARGRGWALLKAVVAIPYYRDTNPAFAAFARRTLGRVLADP